MTLAAAKRRIAELERMIASLRSRLEAVEYDRRAKANAHESQLAYEVALRKGHGRWKS